MPGLPEPLVILECPDHGIPGKVWDGGLILAEFLAAHPEWVQGKKVLEVGSGTGLSGIAAACSGARAVILTDLPDHVPILAANAAASLGAVSAARARLGIEESEGTDGVLCSNL
ncbi:hypothetical protein T484DRAFT_1834213 [Baffinella frigidus]|nr:hypothetical protein T484DRAFT_1834213 [Cryptophyta sp. CCMP2293]